jgi:hypothetical protein
MHSDALLGSEVPMRAHSLGWIHLDWFHEPSRLIGADAEHRDLRATQPVPDIREMS